MPVDAEPLRPTAELPHTIGPYRILGVLGQGGMGVVYRGEDERTGTLAAVKTVKLVDTGMLASLRREIHALSVMRHPGVVRIFEQGVVGGLPWYSMELLAGRTLRAHVHEQWYDRTLELQATVGNDPLAMTAEMKSLPRPVVFDPADADTGPRRTPLVELLTLFRRLCAPLAFLHGKGVVHRDLKPDNVLIRDDGTPVIMDFGLASQFGGAEGREVLEVGGWIVGSVHYMAPEQIQGKFVDARADLYALGCMLYECATGYPPFLGEEVLHQHLRADPVHPSDIRGDVSPPLAELILKLLEKRPRDRLGHAADVAAALADLGASGWDDHDLPPARAYVYRPEFAGRGDVVRTLEAALDRAEMARGSGVFVGGESGVGKTRLAMELATQAALRGFRVITGECVAVGADRDGDRAARGPPLHPLRPLLLAMADHCREYGAPEALRVLGEAGKELAAYEPALAELPGFEAMPDPPRLSPEAARARLLGLLRGALLAFTQAMPVLLILDDLQWADELTTSLLQRLIDAGFAAGRALVVGTYRVEAMDGALRALVDSPGATRLTIGRLDAGTVQAIVADMLGMMAAPEVFVRFLAGQSRGNPFFVVEYLRAAIAEGLLTRDEAGRWRLEARGELEHSLSVVLPLPRTLAELIEARLVALRPGTRALAELAAVFGREFDGDLLIAASSIGDAEGLDALEDLRGRQILEPAAAGRLRFVHDKLREITYDKTAGEARRALHHAAARAIEARWADTAEAPRVYPDLAHHWLRAGVADKACVYAMRAGDSAKAAYANEEAIIFFREAAAQADAAASAPGADGSVWAEAAAQALERLGEVLGVTGRQDDAREAFARALARRPGHARFWRAQVHRKIGKAYERQHQHADALAAHRMAETILGDLDETSAGEWRQVWVQIKLDQIWVYYWLARIPEMDELVAKIRPFVEAHGTQLQRAKYFTALAYRSFRRDRYRVPAETVTHARIARDACAAAGDLSELQTIQVGLAGALLYHDSLDAAEREMLAAVELTRKTGDVVIQARALTYLAMIYRRKRGSADRVRETNAELLAVATAGQIVEYVGAARANLAWLAWLDGDADAVLGHGAAALARWGQTALVYPFQWFALLPLLDVKLRRGRLADAVADARVLLDPAQQRLPDALTGALEHAVAAWARERPAEAESELARAVVLACEHGYL